MSSINPQTSLYLADSRTNPGTVNLPDSASFTGRTITIKDQFGSASMSTIAISTVSPDTFDDGTNIKYITDNYGLYTLSAVSSNVWTVMNTSITPVVHTSTLYANTISTSSMIASSISSYFMSVEQDFYLQNYLVGVSNDNLTLNGSVLMNIDQNVSTIDGLGSLSYISSSQLISSVGGLNTQIATLPAAVTQTLLYFNKSVANHGIGTLQSIQYIASTNTSTFTLARNTTNLFLEEFRTDFTLPSFIPPGSWDFNIFTQTNDTGIHVKYWADVYLANPTTSNLFFSTSNSPIYSSNMLQSAAMQVDIPYTGLSTTSTLVVKFYGANDSGGSRSLTFFYEGQAAYSHLHTSFGTLVPEVLVTSTVQGLGSYYVSTSGLISTVEGLGHLSTDSFTSSIDGLGSFYLSTSGSLFTLVGNGTTAYNPAANSLTGTATDWVLSAESYPNTFFSCKSPTQNSYFGLNSVTNTIVGYFTYAFFYNSGYLAVSQAGGAQNIGVWDSNDLLSISLTQTSTIFYRNANECARYSTLISGDYQAGFYMSAANTITDIAFAGSKSQNPINSVNFTTIPTNVVYPKNLISSIDGLGSFYQSSFSLFTSTLADPVLSLTGSGILDTYAPTVGISSGNVYIASMTGSVSWSNTPTAGDISRWVICGDSFGISSMAVIEQWQQYNFPASITSNNTTLTGYLYPQSNMNILVGLQNTLTNPGDYTAFIDSFAVQRIA